MIQNIPYYYHKTITYQHLKRGKQGPVDQEDIRKAMMKKNKKKKKKNHLKN